ncbi:hypothetical protein SAMN02910298_01942 [Pseudobutyrivibrio sp. YE44]|uniref:hypothetical protein n=1 Tax=Pseudobutyrivibrio sp. YE44 TaxID=1520802 RepID=UPI00087F63C5|nr:hypothetical protein [Pseudobutyrivibrio sp. YE44]SDB39886.1 hypothetical protein SAMN02910298_01942 [Pseudobutyrivibrio sp. YE44]
MIEVLMILTLEILVLTFGMLFELFPGTKYRMHKPQIQLISSVIICTICAAILSVMLLFPEEINAGNDYANLDMMKPFIVLAVIFLFASIYKYTDMKKSSYELECISLSKEDYTLVHDFDLTLGNYMYMPNVQRTAKCEGFIIVFTSVMPANEIDADFICRKFSEEQYECITIREKELNIKNIIKRGSSLLLFLLCIVDVAFFVLSGHQFSNTAIGETVYEVFTNLLMVLFGLAFIKTFIGVNSLIRVIFEVLGLVMIIVGVVSLVGLF